MRTRAAPVQLARQIQADPPWNGSTHMMHMMHWVKAIGSLGPSARPCNNITHTMPCHATGSCRAVPHASTVIRATFRFLACCPLPRSAPNAGHRPRYGHAPCTPYNQLQLRHHLTPSPYSTATTRIPTTLATSRSYPCAEAAPYPGGTHVLPYHQQTHANLVRQHGFLFQPLPSTLICTSLRTIYLRLH